MTAFSPQRLDAPLNILLIEDDEGDRDLTMAYLSADDSNLYEVICAHSLEDGLARLKETVFDAVILDLVLPDSRGVATVQKLCAQAQGIPVIVSSYFDEKALANKAIELGAQDYLPKDKMDTQSLSRILGRALARARYQAQQISATRLSERRSNPLAQKIERLQKDIDQLETIASNIHQSSQGKQSLEVIRQRMVTTLSHECRSPATVILLATNILKKYTQPTDTKYQLAINKIETATQQLMRLIDTALKFDHVPQLMADTLPEKVNLRSLCDELIAELESKLAGTVEVFYQGECSTASLHREVAEQIVEQLLTNAIIYSPERRTAKLTVRDCGEQVTFTVEDKGIGIPENERSQVFEAFYRLSYVDDIHGLGLGLTIVKTCAELCGGTVALDSEVGKGTTVVVTLPTLNEGERGGAEELIG